MTGIIPHEQRYANLKAKLDVFVVETHTVIAKAANFDMRQRNIFLALVRPWLLPANVDTAIKQEEEKAREIALKAEFPAEEIATAIRDIYEHDTHLRDCCGEPLALTYLFDELYVHSGIELLLQGASHRLGELFNNFEKVVYGQGPYTKIAYSHIFNFSCKIDDIDLRPLIIKRVSTQDIASVLGGPTAPTQYAFLQPPQVGTFFVVYEEMGAVENLSNWLWNAHLRASELFRVIQYHKYCAAYVDYSALHFSPAWVNNLRRPGLFFVGNPRRLPYLNGTKQFELFNGDLGEIRQRINAYLSAKIVELMKDNSSAFRQASLRAGDYYEASMAEEHPASRLIALAIALESLFSPADGQEISYKTSLAASQLLGADAEGRKRVFSDLQDLYKRRSKIMHGSYDVKKVYEGTFVTHEDIDRWSPYLCEGIVRFLTLYFRGKRTKNELDAFRAALLACALDNANTELLRAESDLGSFIEEMGLSTPA
jgi:hypothetical protein